MWQAANGRKMPKTKSREQSRRSDRIANTTDMEARTPHIRLLCLNTPCNPVYRMYWKRDENGHLVKPACRTHLLQLLLM